MNLEVYQTTKLFTDIESYHNNYFIFCYLNLPWQSLPTTAVDIMTYVLSYLLNCMYVKINSRARSAFTNQMWCSQKLTKSCKPDPWPPPNFFPPPWNWCSKYLQLKILNSSKPSPTLPSTPKTAKNDQLLCPKSIRLPLANTKTPLNPPKP